MRLHHRHPDVVREICKWEAMVEDDSGPAGDKTSARIATAIAAYESHRACGEFVAAKRVFSRVDSLRYYVFRFYYARHLSEPETFEETYWTVNRDTEQCEPLVMSKASAIDMICTECMQDIRMLRRSLHVFCNSYATLSRARVLEVAGILNTPRGDCTIPVEFSNERSASQSIALLHTVYTVLNQGLHFVC